MGILGPDGSELTHERSPLNVNLVLTESQLGDLLKQNTVTAEGGLLANAGDRSIALHFRVKNPDGKKDLLVPIISPTQSRIFQANIPLDSPYKFSLATGPYPPERQKKPQTLDRTKGDRVVSCEQGKALGITMMPDASKLLEFKDAWSKPFMPLSKVMGMPEGPMTETLRDVEDLAIIQAMRTPPNDTVNPHFFVVIFDGIETMEVDAPLYEMKPRVIQTGRHAMGELFGILRQMGMHEMKPSDVKRKTIGLDAVKPIAAFEVHFGNGNGQTDITQTPS